MNTGIQLDLLHQIYQAIGVTNHPRDFKNSEYKAIYVVIKNKAIHFKQAFKQ